MLTFSLRWKIGIANAVAQLLDVIAVHRHSLGKVNHLSKQLAKYHPVIVRVITPEFRFFLAKTQKFNDLKRNLGSRYESTHTSIPTPTVEFRFVRLMTPKMCNNIFPNPVISLAEVGV